MNSEMLFIAVLALLIFGPRRLPEIGRQLGKALAEFKRAKNEFTAQIEDEVRRMEQPAVPSEVQSDLHSGVQSDLHSEAQSEVQSEAQSDVQSGPVLVENNSIKPPSQPPSGTIAASDETSAGPTSEYPSRVQGTNA
jgi:sec-independent protein translocase protein TatB